MQRYTIFFIIVNALHVSGGFSAHHQELKSSIHIIWYVPSLLAATASGSSKQTWHIPDAVCTVLELLMMGGETARNMYSIDNNKEYCITLHLVGYTKKNT